MTPKFMAIMMTWNRFDLLERTIESYNKSVVSPILHVFDDGSKDRDRLVSILERIKGERKVHLSDRSNCSRRTRYALAYMFNNYPSLEAVINLNSDMIFNPNWFSVMMDRYEILKNMDRYFGALSVYNYKGHKHFKSINLNSEGTIRVLQKQSIGIFGCCITREFWLGCVESISRDSGWEYVMSKMAKSHNLNMYCTMPSYVQHIGTKEGVHAHRSVKARDFIGE